MGFHIRNHSSPAATLSPQAPPVSINANYVQDSSSRRDANGNGSTKSVNKRRSWFGIPLTSRPKSKVEQPPNPVSEAPISEDNRYRPIQFSPNRIATLYVTPSEQNLYLAAMSQLENPPPNLHLWSEPTPALPALAQQVPFEARLPDHITQPDLIDTRHPLTDRPLSPKLVTSPGVQAFGTGLNVRDEFRMTRVPPKPTQHALLSLVPPSTLRFTGFPSAALIAADQAMVENWPGGFSSRSESVEKLTKRGDKEGALWKVNLQGRVWKRKGHQELDSIHLLLSVFTALGIHGWITTNSIQAGGNRRESHNLLFSYSPDTFSVQPLFFAISFPLPDRISIISAPSKTTPAIITAVRSAITSSSASKHKARPGRPQAADSAAIASSGASSRVSWSTNSIKLEGWVYPGVYRFWVGGMRRWVVGGVRRKVIDNLHPNLVLALVNNVSALHLSLVASVPLFPRVKGRDILIFSSLPTSGLSYRDTFKPDVPTRDTSSSETPVMVSPPASMAFPASTILDDPQNRRQGMIMQSERNSPMNGSASGSTTARQSQNQGQGVGPEVVGVDESGQRVLPWTSILAESPHTNPINSIHANTDGHQRSQSADQSVIPSSYRRSSSAGSNRPLMAAGGGGSSRESSPTRKRHKLLKKSSTKRKTKNRGSAQSLPAQPPDAGPTYAPNLTYDYQYQVPQDLQRLPPAERNVASGVNNAGDMWSMVDVPLNVGQLGMSVYENRQSTDGTQESGDSHYEDAQAVPVSDLDPRHLRDQSFLDQEFQQHSVDDNQSMLPGPVPAPLPVPLPSADLLQPTRSPRNPSRQRYSSISSAPNDENLLRLGQSVPEHRHDEPQLRPLNDNPNLINQEGYGGLPLRDAPVPRSGRTIEQSDGVTSLHGSVGFSGQSILSLQSGSHRSRNMSGPERRSEDRLRGPSTEIDRHSVPMPPIQSTERGTNGLEIPPKNGPDDLSRMLFSTKDQKVPEPSKPAQPQADITREEPNLPGGWTDGPSVPRLPSSQPHSNGDQSTDKGSLPSRIGKMGIGRLFKKDDKGKDNEAVANGENIEGNGLETSHIEQLDRKGKGKAINDTRSEITNDTMPSDIAPRGSGPGAAGSGRTKIKLGGRS